MKQVVSNAETGSENYARPNEIDLLPPSDDGKEFAMFCDVPVHYEDDSFGEDIAE